MKSIFDRQEDKLNYLKGLIRIAKCNGVIEPEELEYLSLIAKGMEIDGVTEQSVIITIASTNEEIHIEFSSRYIAVFFLQEAIQLCAVDGSFDEAEQQEIKLIADELHISQEDLQRLLSWVMEGVEWKQRGEKLVSEIAEVK